MSDETKHQSKTDGAGDPVGQPRNKRRGLGLSGKLLLLTIGFVMIAEVLVFVPSVANFRKNWLMERLAAAQIASVAAEAVPAHELPAKVRDELLRSAQVHGIAYRGRSARRLIMRTDIPKAIDGHYDLRGASPAKMISDALAVYMAPADRMIRVIGQPGFGPGEFIEIVIPEAPLKAAMIRFGLNILGLSIIISMITAALVYLAINTMLIRPMTRITSNLVHFGEDPEDPGRQIVPSDRKDEIGTAERELAHMQGELVGTLQQKSRLAALGLAVSKINHDLRNMLASAQLISDRLGAVNDPTVKRFAPKLIASMDRAIALCTDTLKFGRAQEAPPERMVFPLRPLVDEVGDSLGLSDSSIPRFTIDVEPELQIDADHGQLFRVLSNLVRNASQALEQLPDGAQREIGVVAVRKGGVVIISVQDSGPGVPERARAHLFEPFHGSARKGGTGLGLAIASELIRAHGGSIELLSDGPGATFELTVPDQVVELRGRRASSG